MNQSLQSPVAVTQANVLSMRNIGILYIKHHKMHNNAKERSAPSDALVDVVQGIEQLPKGVPRPIRAKISGCCQIVLISRGSGTAISRKDVGSGLVQGKSCLVSLTATADHA